MCCGGCAMNDKVIETLNESARTGQPVEIGQIVVCDFCDTDFTERDDQGGLLFGGRGVCPECAPRIEADAIKFGETRFIKARAKPGQSFRSFCLELRGGNNTVHFRTIEL